MTPFKSATPDLVKFAFFFAVFFLLSAIGQFYFVKYETNYTVTQNLDDSVKTINTAVDYRTGVDVKAYNQAATPANNFAVVLSDGMVLDIGLETDKGLVPDLIPAVRSPILSDEVFLRPAKIAFSSPATSHEDWWVIAKHLDHGVAIVGISGYDPIADPAAQLAENIKVFGETVEQTTHVRLKDLSNAIQNWAVITDDGRLVGGSGRVPLYTDPMALGRIPLGVRDQEIEGKPFLVLYTPLRDKAGRPVGTIVIAQEITFERAALGNQIKFALGVALVSFVVFIALWARYSTAQERKRREIQEAFQHYFSPQIMEAILQDPDKLKLGGVRREITILFSDIRSFTSLSETLPPQVLTKLLHEYFSEMTDEVQATDGIVDKYIGDAIMAFWGAPIEQPDQADRAVTTALNMIRRVKLLREKWKRDGYGDLDIGIGINLGVATVGNFGSAKRFDYTVIGDAVNSASRIEGLNKQYGCNIIISESTKSQLTIDVKTEDLGEVTIRGKEQPVRLYRIDTDE